MANKYNVGDVYTFKGTRKSLKMKYDPQHSFKIIDVAKEHVILKMIAETDADGNSYGIIAKPFIIIDEWWYKNSKKEIIAWDVLYGK